MKKYFVKYLPVEGEIKEGDNVLIHTGEIRKVVQETLGLCWWRKDGSAYMKLNEKDKKVKLFLCSRDIVAGDEVQDENGFKYNVDDRRLKLLSKENEHLKTKVYKVIGEISPKARWINEGDEFEGHKVDLWFRGDYIQVKGPCGHFH